MLTVYLGATLAIPSPGAYRRALLRLGLFARARGYRVPASERREPDPLLVASLADAPADRERLRAALARGRLVFAGAQDASTVWLPRGLLGDVRALAPTRIVDRRLAFRRELDFRFRATLYPAQYRAVARVLAAGGGLLVAPPGAGKTRMAMACLAAWRQPAVWLTHRRDLVGMVREKAAEYWNLDARTAIGVYGMGDESPGSHMVVCMLQTLADRPDLTARLAAWAGAVVIDEGQHVPAQTFDAVASRFPAAYRLGLTGTPERTDGLGRMIAAICGPVAAAITQEEAVHAGLIVLPSVLMVDSGYRHSGSRDWTLLEQSRAMDARRNAVICALVRREAAAGGRLWVLVERIDHARLLAEMLRRQYGVPAVAVAGDLDPRRRQAAYAACEAGRVVLVCTPVVEEGLDYPAVDALVLGAPGRSAPRLRQRVGRIMRAWRGKRPPRVYDVCDMGVPVLAEQARARWRVYQEMGWPIRDAM